MENFIFWAVLLTKLQCFDYFICNIFYRSASLIKEVAGLQIAMNNK